MPIRNHNLIGKSPDRSPLFSQRPSIEELMHQQGTRPVRCIEDLLGGWPEDQIDDGFEEALMEWRRADHPTRD